MLEELTWENRFDRFYSFSVPSGDENLTPLLSAAIDDLDLRAAIGLLENLFGCRLATNARFELQRYVDGSGIGAHTDRGTSEVRGIINLNRGWDRKDGAIWVLAQDSALSKRTKFLPSISNTGFFFRTSQDSYHALSEYRGKEAFALIVRIPEIQPQMLGKQPK